MSDDAELNRDQESESSQDDGVQLSLPAGEESPGLISRGIKGMVSLGVDAVTLPVRVLKPIIMSDTLAPARTVANQAVNTVVDASVSVVGDTMRGNEEFANLVSAIVSRLLKELRASDLLADLIRTQIGLFLDYLVRHPETIAPLVEEVAGNYLRTLKQNPTLLRPLVRVVADDYLAYVAQNPDMLEEVVNTAADGYLNRLRSRLQVMDGLVQALGNRYVDYLAQNPALLDVLVERAAEQYLTSIEGDPQRLDNVVRSVGDRYLEYLNQEPDTVQALLQGQSQNLAAGMLNEVRERSAVGDYALEDAFRRLLGRKPRSRGQ
jgi:hypothetical protein